MLADAFALLLAGGLVMSVGMASLEPTTIDFEAARIRAAGSRTGAAASWREPDTRSPARGPTPRLGARLRPRLDDPAAAFA
jgi:hypothetical protein